MATEIERKFLVRSDAWRAHADDAHSVHIRQGYLTRAKERTVRVRVAENDAYLTIKGATKGMSRSEFEYPIPMSDAEQLLQLCEPSIVEKVRHTVVVDGTRWEIDEFLGDNAGLVVAEVELRSEDQPFARPEWLGDEVTDDPRYYNSNLSQQPYRIWRGR